MAVTIAVVTRDPVCRVLRKNLNAPRFATRETAWLVVQIVHIASELRIESWCLGEVHMRHLRVSNVGVHRSKGNAFFNRVIDPALAFIHKRRGHDQGCKHLGVSVRVLRRLIVSQAPAACAGLLIDAVEETLCELTDDATGGWHAQKNSCVTWPAQLFEHHVETRITPVRPQVLPTDLKKKRRNRLWKKRSVDFAACI